MHHYWSFKVTWLGEGVAWYWSGQLKKLADLEIPSHFDDLVFWWEGKEKTMHAYNCSGWIVRFIYEELLISDINSFKQFFNNPYNYEIIGIAGEDEFFEKWQRYVIEMSEIYPSGYQYILE